MKQFLKLPFFSLISLVLFVLLFFHPVFSQNKLPIPSDTIIGLYHPFRDLYADLYPNGIPFKNFLITDPVRQQYPWRELLITIEKKLELPLWNPYSFSGTPFLANHQSAAFYFLNVLLIVLPFPLGWSFLIISQPLLMAVFLFLYLQNIGLKKEASMLGGLVFALGGFSIAWMEWGNILHVALWLPLILLAIDKVFEYSSSKIEIKNKRLVIWLFVFVFSLISSFFAGHLQTFFYLLVTATIYLFARWIQYRKQKIILVLFSVCYFLFAVFTAVQWIPTLQLILLSAREIDQANWQQPGWFIPWQHLIQFVAPDFFGNPATLNYWGIWNYAEFIGYVGLFPLLITLFALFFRHDRKTLFFATIFFTSLFFSLPTFLAKLPYWFGLPLLSTAQPTRLLFLSDFSLAVLAALGLDYFIRTRKKEIIYPVVFIALIIAGLWLFILAGNEIFEKTSQENLAVARRNLILPTGLFFITLAIITAIVYIKKKIIREVLFGVLLLIVVFDLFRFGMKFMPFTDKEYLFPNTQALSFLKEREKGFRIMTTDSRILPPNFSILYRIQSIDGYDPLYLLRYAELIAASERGEPNISTPFGFNRIITPHRYESKIIDLLGVKYILSLSDLSSSKLQKVFQEGQTRVYENRDVFPRAFFAEEVRWADDKQEAIRLMYEESIDLRKTAIVEKPVSRGGAQYPTKSANGKAKILLHEPNKIVVETENDKEGFLILTDSFYPTWKAKIFYDQEEFPLRYSKEAKIYRADFNFRGVFVDRGKNRVEFYNSLLPKFLED